MRPYSTRRLAWLAGWLISGTSLFAAPNALIVIGSTGSPTVSSDLLALANRIQTDLQQRGFAAEATEVLSADGAAGKITKEQVLASLKKRESLQGSDEFWLILLGFSGRTGEDVPAFQVTGPRLTVPDLKTALDAIPAKQFVFVATSDSGSFIEPLLTANRTVLAATREEGEIDMPRFPEAWEQSLKANPKADWTKIAADAAAATDKLYVDSSLAVGEHARLGDPVTGKILEAPFGTDAISTPAGKMDDGGPMALINADDIKIPIRKPNAEWEKQAATPDTLKRIAEAKAAPNPDGFNSVMLEQRLSYRVNEDRTAEDFVLRRIYLASEDSVSRWANFLLPQSPPAVTTKLEAARIIQPDGSSIVFNPAKMPAASDCSSGMCGALTQVFFPNAHAGCLVEIAYRTRHVLNASLPMYSEEMMVQQEIPVLATQLQLQVPGDNQVHFKLRNSDQKAVEGLVNGIHTYTWKLANLPAFEPLPNDPPERDFAVMLDISSLNSWADFIAWYRSLTKGSDDATDPDVKAKAAELAAAGTSRVDKIRRAYEFVSALRYLSTGFGINGIRPHTPALVLQNRYGDCKDKANLLIALLTNMGIDARFCVLNRGSSTDVSFPSWQFNHAIAYVPKAPDQGQAEDLWLDTTDSTAPFPTLSPGDIGRSGLVFNPKSADFLTISNTGKTTTNLEEIWKFQEQANGSWTGTLQNTWSGLGEYDVRSAMRGASPRQRDAVLQIELAKLLGDADFTALKLSPVDDLSIPLKMDAKVSVPTEPSPRPATSLQEMFASPERNRPLLLNNGQSLHLKQTVELTFDHGEPATVPAPFDAKAGGVQAKASWENLGNHNWRRTMQLDIDDPLVSQADYAAVRKLLRDWNSYLSH